MATVTLVPIEGNEISIPFGGETVRVVLPSLRRARQKSSDKLLASDDDSGEGGSAGIDGPPRVAHERPHIRVKPIIRPLGIRSERGEVGRVYFVRLGSNEELANIVAKLEDPGKITRSRRPRDLIVSLNHPDIDVRFASEKLSNLPEDTNVHIVV